MLRIKAGKNNIEEKLVVWLKWSVGCLRATRRQALESATWICHDGLGRATL